MSDGNIILIDIDIHSDNKLMKTKLKEFVKNYKRHRDKLCKHLSSETDLPVPDSIGKYKEYENGKIYYLFDKTKKEIVAFAITSTDSHNITTLEWLCSSNNIDKKTTKMDGKPLGIYLLDVAYDEYVNKNEGGVLKIEPANEKLVDYYSKWKTPTLPSLVEGKEVGIIKSKPDIIFDTGSYLVYFNKEIPLSDIQIKRLININEFEFICEELDLNPNDVLKIDKEKRKDFLHERAADEEYDYSETIDNINYYTLDDIKKELEELYKINKLSGGVYKYRKTKKNKKNKCKKSSRCRYNL
jgi:hypothetical protein